MRLIKFILTFLTLLALTTATAQSDSKVWRLQLNKCYLTLGYLFQKEHLLESGLKIEYIKNDSFRNHENVSIIPGGQLTRHDQVTYLNPYVMLRYFKPIADNWGLVAATSYNYRTVLGVTSTALTPEIGFKNEVATLTYGYNIFLDNKYDWTLPHRLSLRLMVY